jgi:hypothetical protein
MTDKYIKPLLTIILVLIFNQNFGQNLHNDSIVNSFINRLVNKGTDTILIYEKGCVGCEDLIVLHKDDSCFYYGKPKIYNIFWKFNGLSYASKLSNYDCYEYDTISYDIGLIWDSYFKNKKLIKNERILPPSYVDKKDTLYVDIDHYSYSQIMIIENKEIVDFEINDFYFRKTIDEVYRNLNYERNSNSFRKKLQIQLENEIKNIEDNKLIKKTAYNTRYSQ